MAHLPSSSPPLLLISDSGLGLVWRLDAATGNYSVHYRHETMAPTTDLGLLLGINGLRYLDGHVYYVNSPRRLFARYPVDPRTGAVAGEARVLAEGVLSDDFNVRKENGGPVGYLAGLNDNVVTRVTLDGAKEVVAGGLNSSTVAGATSGAWGRTAVDEDVLYVTTGGASAAPVNGTFVEGGKIVALTLAE
ncbi:Six-bladed beta-propeller TolB-like protein [Macrophomina phaseolina MS6]|uniref:Six-bladed beta-propeller TolB-like protein n=1 Tax=Macrophomina phaseolina (strain MS6) TaxID=1126212 RepID=K2QIM1_MACPH|nr:Six-bladed beta-propeller TolB-like protein [Macrophomina phaseolina MS6]